MKRRHWQGYGTVNVKKLSPLHFIVSGEHEQGCLRDDLYDMVKFFKLPKPYTQYKMTVTGDYSRAEYYFEEVRDGLY